MARQKVAQIGIPSGFFDALEEKLGTDISTFINDQDTSLFRSPYGHFQESHQQPFNRELMFPSECQKTSERSNGLIRPPHATVEEEALCALLTSHRCPANWPFHLLVVPGVTTRVRRKLCSLGNQEKGLRSYTITGGVFLAKDIFSEFVLFLIFSCVTGMIKTTVLH